MIPVNRELNVMISTHKIYFQVQKSSSKQYFVEILDSYFASVIVSIAAGSLLILLPLIFHTRHFLTWQSSIIN